MLRHVSKLFVIGLPVNAVARVHDLLNEASTIALAERRRHLGEGLHLGTLMGQLQELQGARYVDPHSRVDANEQIDLCGAIDNYL